MLVTAIGDCLVNAGKFTKYDCEKVHEALVRSARRSPATRKMLEISMHKDLSPADDEPFDLCSLHGKFVRSLLHRDEFAEVALPYREAVVRKLPRGDGQQQQQKNDFLKLNIVLYAMGTWLQDSIASLKKALQTDFSKAKLAKNVQTFCNKIQGGSGNYNFEWPKLVIKSRKGNFQKENWFLDLFDLAVRCAPIESEEQNLQINFLKSRAKAIERTTIIRDKRKFRSLLKFIESEEPKDGFFAQSTAIYSPLQNLLDIGCSPNTKWTCQQKNERISKLEELMELYKSYFDVMVLMNSVKDIRRYEITEATRKLSNQIYGTIKQQATGSLVCEMETKTFMSFMKSFEERSVVEFSPSITAGTELKSVNDSQDSTETLFSAEPAVVPRDYHEISENIEKIELKLSKMFNGWNEASARLSKTSLQKTWNRFMMSIRLIFARISAIKNRR